MAEDAKGKPDGGAGAGEQKPAEVTGQDAKPTDGKAPAWYTKYPSEMQDLLKVYNDEQSLAKEHIDLKKKFVVPEDPKEYEFEAKDMDDIQKKNLEEFKTKAKEFGLTKEQFKKLTEYEFELSKQLRDRVLGEAKKTEQAEKEKVQKAVDDLKSEWGNKFEENINRAKKTMQQIFPSSFGVFLEDSGLGNHPEMVRAMVRLADSISEDALVRNQSRQPKGNRDPQTGEPMLKFTSTK